jgi:UDP-glucose 4-epimerase
MMRVLVTGAGGFSGIHIVRSLIRAGHDVMALMGRKEPGHLTVQPSGPGRLTVLAGDLAEDIALPQGVNAVVHTAAMSPGHGITTAELIRNNAEATRRLVEWSRSHGVEKFINFSSLSVFGRIEGPVLDECAPRLDPDAYGVSKWLGEQVLHDAGEAMASVSFRLPAVVGPRPVRHWLAMIVQAAREGREITYYHGDADYNNAVHINDLCRFVESLLQRKWEGHDVIVLAAAGVIKIREAVTAIATGIGGGSRIREIPPLRPAFTISIARAQKLYDYEPMRMRDLIVQFVAENRLIERDVFAKHAT